MTFKPKKNENENENKNVIKIRINIGIAIMIEYASINTSTIMTILLVHLYVKNGKKD